MIKAKNASIDFYNMMCFFMKKEKKESDPNN